MERANVVPRCDHEMAVNIHDFMYSLALNYLTGSMLWHYQLLNMQKFIRAVSLHIQLIIFQVDVVSL